MIDLEGKFIGDVEKMMKEVLVILNKNLSREKFFEDIGIVMDEPGMFIQSHGLSLAIKVYPINYPASKTKWVIKLIIVQTHWPDKLFGEGIIEVSNKDDYTKKELNLAKKNILAMINNVLKQHFNI